jgi:preprotein translocase subunit SecE
MKSIVTFFSEVRSELSKVTWPKRQEVIRLTLIVFSISLIVGLYVGGLDYSFTKLLTVILAR